MRTRLIMDKELYRQMVAHCVKGLPDEACGILGGRDETVLKVYAMTNTDPSPSSFLMKPEEQFAVMKDMMENGLETVAYFHSHPNSEAYPSQKDMSYASYPDSLYVIVSLSGEPSARAFSIVDETIKEVKIEIAGGITDENNF